MEMIAGLNTELLGMMKGRLKEWKCDSKIGDIFLSMVSYEGRGMIRDSDGLFFFAFLSLYV